MNFMVICFLTICVHAIIGQARVQCADSITVRMGMAEEYFEGAGRHNDECGMMKACPEFIEGMNLEQFF